VTGVGFAPAKVNLALHVGPPRADGRHPLDSLAAFADFGDDLTAETIPGEGAVIAVSGPFAADLAGETDNLVLRAAALLRDRLGDAAGGVRLSLHKALPVASGLGGGSADAAATLRLLARHWGAPLDLADLAGLAGQLGADCPVCVFSRSARMLGDGRELAFEPLPALDAVLVNPGAPSPTAAVYRAFDALGLGGEFSPTPRGPWTDADDFVAALAHARNDLETPAIRVTPRIADVLADLRARASVRLARLSGSGATCFAIAVDRAAAWRLAAEISNDHPGWWVQAVRLGG